MAFIYEKKDPGSNKRRWYARIKVGTNYETVSLKLLAPENKRLAEARAQRLQVECDVTAISDDTREWLGSRRAGELAVLAGRAGVKIDASAPDCWQSAMDGYIRATEAKDSRRLVPGKTFKDEEGTKYQRMATIRRFVRRAESTGLKFLKEPITISISDYLKWRLEHVAPGTVWSKDYSFLTLWGDWLSGRGICERPNRLLIKEGLPAKGNPIIVLPPWQSDLECLSFYHANRIKPTNNHNYNRNRSWFTLWTLVAIVRGMGCRPSEATRLDWSTVELDRNRVRFLASKNGTHRTVPILYQWTHDALVEIRERTGDKGPVCKTLLEGTFERLSSACSLMARLSVSVSRKPYHLKVAQKLQLNHLIRLGFPPHVVSKWSDHSLSMQERHYMEENAYLPPDASENYGGWGKLTAYGESVRAHLSSFSKDIGGG